MTVRYVNTGALLTSAQGVLVRQIVTTPIETSTIANIAANGTVQFDASTQAILYYTTASTGNWTLNLRGNSTVPLTSYLAVGQTITVAFLATNTGTAYYQTALTIDGAAQTVKWQGGSAPTAGNTNSTDVYTFTVVKTAVTPTYTVFGQLVKFA